MKVIIEANIEPESANDPMTTDIVFTNDNLQNVNFVDMIIDSQEYTLSVTDLFDALAPFLLQLSRESQDHQSHREWIH